MGVMDDQLIEVLDPVSPPNAQEYHLSKRPRSLQGKTIAVVDENQPNAREILEQLSDLLLSGRAGVKRILFRNPRTGYGFDLEGGRKTAAAKEPLESIAAKSDAAVVGVAH